MKFNSLVLLLTFLTVTFSYSQTTYFIKYKDNVSITEVDRRVADQRVSNSISFRNSLLPDFDVNYLAKGLGRGHAILGRIVKIQFTESVSESEFSSLLSSDPDIEYIQKANTYQINLMPNDSLAAQQWALEKIKAFEAWDITTGADTVLLAIIDTGIEYFHPDLQNKIYYNPSEMGMTQPGDPCWTGVPEDKRFNNCDDDGNGFIDDYMGWDFTDRVGFPFDSLGGDYLGWDNDPFDDHGHGTYIAGIAGAETNNITGIAGAAPNIKILNLRAFDPGGYGEEDDVAAAILYASQSGAKIINMSFGDNSFSLVLRDVVKYAYSQNIVMVASSGNSGSSSPHYPSGYSEVICVGNSTDQDFVAPSSNWGSTIDLVAPGSSVLTTSKNNGYALISGTSASAPYVSAAASLILSLGNYSNEEVKQILKSTTDDIGDPGWDLRSGSGRLNMKNALTVLAPAEIKFFHPSMDFATNKDTVEIIASVLSPYFVSYNLEVGRGLNPTQWTKLIEDGRNQFSQQSIYNLNVTSSTEDVYTLRLIVYQSNGRTLEERINFYIIRTAPEVVIVGDGPVFYGDKSTIQAEVYTNQRSVVRMYYRKFSTTEFNFITLDGFNTNNQFIKQFHYGFIPKEIIEPNYYYEVYYEAENLAGLKTTVLDSANNLNYFLYRTDDSPDMVAFTQMPYSLPQGVIYKEPLNFLSNQSNEVLFQEFYPTSDLYYSLYQYQDDSLFKIDSIPGRIPRLSGDFNNNGKEDLISVFYPKGFIEEQTQAGVFNLTTIVEDNKVYFPVIVADLSDNGSNELITNAEDRAYIIWQINNDLTLSFVDTLYKAYQDTLEPNFEFNNYVYNNMVVVDSDGDGKKEVWFVDADGDLKSYKLNTAGNYVRGDSLLTPFRTPKTNALAAGDYNGDGLPEFAIIYQTNSIAPNYLLLILNFRNGQLNLISQKVFLDQSAEYFSSTFSRGYQSLEFVDVTGDGKDELVLNLFPYSYILKYDGAGDKIIFFDEGTNNVSAFIGDLNQNGVPEIAFTYTDGVRFFEFAESDRPAIPKNVTGYSISSNTVSLSWYGQSDFYYVFRGTDRNNLILIDSVMQYNYFDSNVADNTYYYYGIKAYDPVRPEPISGMSRIIDVFVHQPARAFEVINNSTNSVIVRFTNKIKNTIENLQAFELIGVGYPNSVSPSDQFSYLLSFTETLPDGQNRLLVRNLRDFYNSPIQEDTISFLIQFSPDEIDFYVSSFEILNPYLIKVEFNFPVDENSARNVNNYFFEPSNKVSEVTFDANDKKIIYLDLRDQKPVGSVGREYVLRIENVLSDAAMGNILIKSGAGSYIVLTGFVADLSEVYVYPNPVRAGERHTKVTFANLPQKARITIWDVNGFKVNELEETDGNGGVDFNLTNEFGERISTGVYIYRVVMIDDQNNEGDEKLGKFAVIK